MSFLSTYRHGFARIAAGTSRSAIADPAANAEAILRVSRDCDARGAAVAVFPELALSAYSIEDLLLQDALLDGVERAAAEIIEASRGLLPMLVLGAPMRHAGRVYNTALVIHRGRLLGDGGRNGSSGRSRSRAGSSNCIGSGSTGPRKGMPR